MIGAALLASLLVTGAPVHVGPLDPVRHAAIIHEEALAGERRDTLVQSVPDGAGGLYLFVNGRSQRVLYRVDARGRLQWRLDDPFEREDGRSGWVTLVPFPGGYGAVFDPSNGPVKLARYDRKGRLRWSAELARETSKGQLHRAGEQTYFFSRKWGNDEPLYVQRIDGRGRHAFGTGVPLDGTERPRRGWVIGVAEDRGAMTVVADVRRTGHGICPKPQEPSCRAWRIRRDGTLAWTRPVEFGVGAAPAWTTHEQTENLVVRNGAVQVNLVPIDGGEAASAKRVGYRISRSGRVRTVPAADRPERRHRLPATLEPMPDLRGWASPLGDAICPLVREGRWIVHRPNERFEPEGLAGCGEVDLSVRLPVNAGDLIVLDPGAGGPPVRLAPDVASDARHAPPAVAYAQDSRVWLLDPFGLRTQVRRGVEQGWTVAPPHRVRSVPGGAEILGADGRVVLSLLTRPSFAGAVRVQGRRIAVGESPELSSKGRSIFACPDTYNRFSRHLAPQWIDLYWSRGRPPPRGPRGLSAFPLPGGRVLVLPRGTPHPPAVLDVTAGRWSAAEGAPEGLRVAAAASLPDGRILVAGHLGRGAVPSAWRVDPVSGTWTWTPGPPRVADVRRAIGAGTGVLMSPEGDLYVHQADTGSWSVVPLDWPAYQLDWRLLPGGRVYVTSCEQPRRAVIVDPATLAVASAAPSRWCYMNSDRATFATLAPHWRRFVTQSMNAPEPPRSFTWRFLTDGLGLMPLGPLRAASLTEHPDGLAVVEVSPWGPLGAAVLLDTRQGYDAALALPDGTLLILGGGERPMPMLVRRPGATAWEHLVAR